MAEDDDKQTCQMSKCFRREPVKQKKKSVFKENTWHTKTCTSHKTPPYNSRGKVWDSEPQTAKTTSQVAGREQNNYVIMTVCICDSRSSGILHSAGVHIEPQVDLKFLLWLFLVKIIWNVLLKHKFFQYAQSLKTTPPKKIK